MTKQEAEVAMEASIEVKAGKGEDHDRGRIHEIDGEMAIVGWQSGVRTPCPIADLSVAGPEPDEYADPPIMPIRLTHRDQWRRPDV